MADFMPRGEAAKEALTNKIQATRKARWERGQLVMSQPSLPNKRDWIKHDAKLSGMARDLIKAAAPAITDSVNEHFLPVLTEAQRLWPVHSGTSRSMLDISYEVLGPATFAAKISSRAPYTAYIYKFDTVRNLILKPGDEAINAMAAAIAEKLGRV